MLFLSVETNFNLKHSHENLKKNIKYVKMERHRQNVNLTWIYKTINKYEISNFLEARCKVKTTTDRQTWKVEKFSQPKYYVIYGEIYIELNSNFLT